MLRSIVSRALLGAALFVAVVPVRSFAGCNVAIVGNIAPTDPNGTATTGQITFNTVGTPAVLQHESSMERVSDVLIYDDTAVAGGNCFAAANRILLSYSGVLTNPSSVQVNKTNFDVYDNKGASGLGITAHSFAGIAANSVTTVVEIDVQTAGTAATTPGGITLSGVGAAVRVKNLRFDATIPASGANITVGVGASSGMPSTFTGVVGVVQSTVAPGAGVVQEGQGTQSAGDTLDTPSIFDFAENYNGSFRVASPNASGVAGDVPTTAPRLIFNLSNALPFGVSVNFPASMQVGGTNGLTMTLVSGGSCSGSAQCSPVYDTTASRPALADLRITTAAAPNSGQDGNLPAIGVFIANPSGYGDVPVDISLVPSHLTTLGGTSTSIMSFSLDRKSVV